MSLAANPLSTILTPVGDQDFLPFSRPTLSQAAVDELVSCLQSGWITTGPRVEKFESDLRDYVQAPHALAVTSATAGLFVTLLALDLKPGDEVITTPMTFVCTLHTIVQAGAKPVLVDIDPKTHNIDITKIEERITPRTRAIVPVHFAGLAVDLDPLYELAKKHNLRIMEDAAHAIGTRYKGRDIGSFGDIQVFSFHPNKNMTTGEGGAIVLRDEDLAKKIQPLRFHGIDRSSFNRFSKTGSQEYDVIGPGFKFNMMDIQAALGIHQLQALDGFIKRRSQLAKRYFELLKDWPELNLPADAPQDGSRHAWHLFTITLKDEAGMDRTSFMNAMKEHNIGTGLHYTAAHLFTYYQKEFGYKQGDFPIAEWVGERIVSLPLFPSMTDAQQDRVVETMKTIFKRS